MNSAKPVTFRVHLYDGRKPIAEAATLLLSGTTAKLIGATVARDYLSSRLRVSPRVGKANRFIALPDGEQLLCADHPALNRLPQEGKTEGVVAWLERRWWVALACLALTVSSVTAGYFYGLPAVAQHIAARTPIEYERKLGEHSVAWLDQNRFFAPSETDSETKDLLTARFSDFVRDLPLAAHYRLEFRASKIFGPNAFAFPGGMVVVTDELIELSESPEEVLAVLAHEIGHVEGRHALRHLLQDSATAALAATITSDAASLTLAVSGLPVLLAQTKYSRDFESEADVFGLALLKRHDVSPEYFATMMEKLGKNGDADIERDWAFLSTHPITAERIDRARTAARP